MMVLLLSCNFYFCSTLVQSLTIAMRQITPKIYKLETANLLSHSFCVLGIGVQINWLRSQYEVSVKLLCRIYQAHACGW
jgi:hypothetical protein